MMLGSKVPFDPLKSVFLNAVYADEHMQMCPSLSLFLPNLHVCVRYIVLQIPRSLKANVSVLGRAEAVRVPALPIIGVAAHLIYAKLGLPA